MDKQNGQDVNTEIAEVKLVRWFTGQIITPQIANDNSTRDHDVVNFEQDGQAIDFALQRISESRADPIEAFVKICAGDTFVIRLDEVDRKLRLSEEEAIALAKDRLLEQVEKDNRPLCCQQLGAATSIIRRLIEQFRRVARVRCPSESKVSCTDRI